MMGIFEGLDMTIEINEYVRFGDFDSREYNMYLVSRSAPTPVKRVIDEPVAFMHGTHDFSRIMGEDIYENRPVIYKFQVNEKNYESRKVLQTSIENRLLKHGLTDLVDTYSRGYHFKGKAMNVDTEDDHRFNRLIITVEFECYPFKIADYKEGNDIWDNFNFELDVSQITQYEVNGVRDIVIYNPGVPSVRPIIKVVGQVKIIKGNQEVNLADETFESTLFRLYSGENKITLQGEGTIEFTYYKELI